MKRKLLALLLCAVLIVSIAACGSTGDNDGNSNNKHDDSTDQQTQQTDGKSPEETNGPETNNDETEPPESKGPAYEITYQNAKVWTNSIGTTWVQTIVEITNTGSTNLYLSSGAYDLEDANGALVTSQSMVSTYPSVLAPGEKGYMYDETTLDDYSGDGNLKILPRPDVEEATVDLIRYNVTDLSVSNDEYFGVNVKGRVENTTEKSENMVYIVAFFYDASGIPIGSVFTILSEDLDAGAKIGFEMSGFSLPDDVTADVIADSIVYAYPTQFQF